MFVRPVNNIYALVRVNVSVCVCVFICKLSNIDISADLRFIKPQPGTATVQTANLGCKRSTFPPFYLLALHYFCRTSQSIRQQINADTHSYTIFSYIRVVSNFHTDDVGPTVVSVSSLTSLFFQHNSQTRSSKNVSLSPF